MVNEDLCGKKKVKYPKQNTLQNMSVAEMRKKLKGLKHVSKMKRQELCEKILEKMNNSSFNSIHSSIHNSSSSNSLSNNLGLGFIQYDGKNSCYIDTTIFSLFHNSHISWVKHVFFKKQLPFAETNLKLHELCGQIRDTLWGIYKDLHLKGEDKSPMMCSRLRQQFAAFSNHINSKHDVGKGVNMKWLSKQQEPTDVVNILMKIFDIQSDIKTRIITKTEKRTDILPFNSPFIDIGELKSKKIVHMRDYIPKSVDTFELEDGTKYKKVTQIIQAKLLIVNVLRNFLNIEKVMTPVIPEEELRVCAVRKGEKCKKILHCISMMIHHGSAKGGHYTCVFKHQKNGQWYHYNDLADGYEFIGDFAEVLKWKNGLVPRNLVNCVYAKL